MSVAVRVFGVELHSRSLIRICTVAAAAMAMGACSADSSRFDAGFGFGSNMSGDGMTTASLRPSETINGAGHAPASYGGTYAGASQQSYAAAPSQPPAHASFQRTPSQQPPRVERVALAPVSRPTPQPAPQAEPAVYRPASAPIAEPAKPAPTKTVTVNSGDTLSSIARRHDASVDDIMAANNMTSTRLSIDQVLKIPSSGAAATQMAKARAHTVREGESIYIIADRYKVNYRELAKYNDVNRPQLIRPGQTLKIPAGGEFQVAANKATKPKSESEGVRVVRTRTIPASTGEPEPVRVASADPNIPIPQSSPSRAASPAPQAEAAKPVRTANLTSPAPMSGTEFRWPVRGRVISKFGPQPNGKHNDGINMAVPLGTPIKAAENGVIAYAGNELEGYGNLILIRHSNGWVSAYAHNSELLVKRGDTVTRGQVVAKAGQSGSVDQPQVHFELRRGSKPVDPMGHMAEM